MVGGCERHLDNHTGCVRCGPLFGVLHCAGDIWRLVRAEIVRMPTSRGASGEQAAPVGFLHLRNKRAELSNPGLPTAVGEFQGIHIHARSMLDCFANIRRSPLALYL